MQRLLLILFGLAIAVGGMQETQAQQSRRNTELPKVDYQVAQIKPVGQGLAVHVKNGGFAMSPKTSLSVAVHDVQSRQLLMTKNLTVPAMHPNQTRRVIFVPPPSAKAIMVKARIDPGNQVKETNERNNVHAPRH